MESKIWSGADICRVLFETKQGVPVEGYNHAVAGKPLLARATGRHTTELGGPPARLSFWVTKAIVEAVKGSKVEAVGLDRGRHWVKANGRVLAYDAEENTWYPVFFPAYLICLLALGEAVSAPTAAHDLLEAYNALQYHVEADGGELGADEATLGLIHRADAELAWWMMYGGMDTDRLTSSRLIVGEDSLEIDLSTARSDLANCLSDASCMAAHINKKAEGVASTNESVAREGEASPAAVHLTYEELLMGDIDLSDVVFRGQGVLAELADAVGHARPCLLWGPTGTGKTTAVHDVVRASGLPMIAVDGRTGMEDQDFHGAMVPNDDESSTKEWGWVDGPLTRAWIRAGQEKIILFVDEITRILPRQLNVLIPALNPVAADLISPELLVDVTPSAWYYVLRIEQIGREYVCPTQHLAFVAACNIGSQYAVEPLDDALASRLIRPIEVDYLDQEDEAWLVKERAGLAYREALALVRVAWETRRQYENGDLAAPLDPRQLIEWAGRVKGLIGRAGTDRMVEMAQRTAGTVWIPSVVGHDHRGILPPGKKEGLLDIVATVIGKAML